MKKLIGFLFFIGGILLGLYVGGWLLFVKPIIDVCIAIDNNTISAVIIGIAIIKCLLASFVGWIIAYLGITIGSVLLDNSGGYKRRRRRR